MRPPSPRGEWKWQTGKRVREERIGLGDERATEQQPAHKQRMSGSSSSEASARSEKVARVA